MRIKGKHVVVSALLLLSAGLAYDGLSSYVNPYLTVNQILSGGDQYVDKSIQIMGLVSQNSISRGENGAVRFDLTDGKETIQVLYEGVLPGNFDQGKDVVVIGTLKREGLVEASRILVKCPSKYGDEGSSPLSSHVFIAALLLAAAAGGYFAYTVLLRRG